MEKLTAYDGDYYYPHCMRGSTCDGRGPSEKCKECEFDERVCVTLGKYEDTDLTPEQIRELAERDTAKAPEEIQDAYGDTRLICPNCRNSVINYFNRSRPPQFCMICGQRLKFGE